LGYDFGFEPEELTAALLPSWLARYHGIEDLTLTQGHVQLPSGEVAEVGLMGTGRRGGENRPVTVLGRCRTRLGGDETRRLADKLDQVAAMLGDTPVVRLVVGRRIQPSADDVAAERGLLLIPCSRINRDRG